MQGSAFGLPGYFRISYATSMENLKKAMERIKFFVIKFRVRKLEYLINGLVNIAVIGFGLIDKNMHQLYRIIKIKLRIVENNKTLGRKLKI